jgi:dihydrofolate reductase
VRVVVINHVSLDGVMQGPGHPDEDTRGGFRHGGWAQNDNDPAMGAAMGERMGPGFSWLFGHWTYDSLLGHWNEVGGPFKDPLNNVTKYVVSSDPETVLPWPNSTLIAGDVPAQIAALRLRPGGNLVVMGSGALVRSLLPHGLIDEIFLMIHPVVLGSGQQLFGREEAAHPLRLVSSSQTASGVILAVYQPAQVAGA